MEFNSCEKLFISEGFLFLGALVACIMALKRGDSDSFGVSQASYADTVAGIWGGVLKSPEWFRKELDLAFAALFPSGSTAAPRTGCTGCTGCSAAFPLPRLLLALAALAESAQELTGFFPEVPTWEWPRARLLLPSAAAIRWPSCGSGPDLVLILLRPSEEARIGESAAAGAASLRWCFRASGLGEALGEGAATAGEPKSLSRFLGVSDLGFFLSDLEEAEEEAGEAAPGAEVGVRGLLLPSGLDESDDLCRDEKKRPLNTIAASPRLAGGDGTSVEQVRWGVGAGRRTVSGARGGERAGGDSAEEM